MNNTCKYSPDGYHDRSEVCVYCHNAEIERLQAERDRQYDYNTGQIVQIAALEARIAELEEALHDAFDVYTENPSASGDDVARAMWDRLGEALKETET